MIVGEILSAFSNLAGANICKTQTLPENGPKAAIKYLMYNLLC
jgi:hypothetical protein